VRPDCIVVRTLVCEDARQRHAIIDSGCGESVQQMCRFLNYAVVVVAKDVRDIATVHE
jgi:hypothetical protein